MTTTDDRQSRTGFDLFPFLPLALIITVFGVAVLIAQVAPTRVTSGVYQVTVGEGPTQFTLATESLTCSRTGDTATCTAAVAGRPLTVNVGYHDPNNTSWSGTCTARHGERPVPCTFSNTLGYASASVGISDSLGVTEPELTRLRDAVPWWRTGGEPSLAQMALLCVLTGIAMGVAAYLLSKRTRPQETAWRLPIATGTGLLGLAFHAIGSLIIAPPNTGHPALIMLMHPLSAAVLAALMAWQYQVCGTGAHSRAQRWGYAINATIATTLYTAPAIFFFLLFSGFVD